jgi:hypothetical protein
VAAAAVDVGVKTTRAVILLLAELVAVALARLILAVYTSEWCRVTFRVFLWLNER